MADGTEVGDDNKLSRRELVKNPWNSLEVTKIGVDIAKGLALPAALAYVGYAITRTQKADEALVARRIKSLDEIAPKANDILCFVAVVGNWKELTPASTIAAKRAIDREMWTYIGIWPDATWSAYRTFIGSIFQEYGGGSGQSAPIYANLSWLRNEMEEIWRPGWERSFNDVGARWDKGIVIDAYVRWMRQLRQDVSASG